MILQNSSIESIACFQMTLQKLKVLKSWDWLSNIDFTYKYGSPIVIIVGSNPSNASPNNSAFHHSTKSRKTVDSWFSNLSTSYCLKYTNLTDEKTKDNIRLKIEIAIALPNVKSRIETIRDKNKVKIIAVGNLASEGLNAIDVDHFAMPHPSDLNRFWNNKIAGEAKIKEMLDWIDK